MEQAYGLRIQVTKGGDTAWSPGDEPQLHAHHDAVVEHPLVAQVFEEALEPLQPRDRSPSVQEQTDGRLSPKNAPCPAATNGADKSGANQRTALRDLPGPNYITTLQLPLNLANPVQTGSTPEARIIRARYLPGSIRVRETVRVGLG